MSLALLSLITESDFRTDVFVLRTEVSVLCSEVSVLCTEVSVLFGELMDLLRCPPNNAIAA